MALGWVIHGPDPNLLGTREPSVYGSTNLAKIDRNLSDRAKKANASPVWNVHRREPFRHHSYFSDLAVAVIAGLGPEGYSAALRYAIIEAKER